MAPPKGKAQKMDLGTFLTDPSLGSWADEMEDMPMPSPSGRSGYGGDRGYSSGGGFNSGGGSLAERGGYSVREQLPLPSKPPYTTHIGNLSFDATVGDVEDLFQGCQVDNVRIVEDKMDMKPKGFGYVEFKTLDGLKKALELSGSQFQGRNIRISVAEPQKDRQEGRDLSDWSRKGPLPDIGGQRKASDRGGFGSGAPRGAGYEPEAGSERPARRSNFEQNDGKVRDFGNWDRKGPLTPTLPNAQPSRSFDRPVSRDGPSIRRNSPAWGEGKSQDGSRPPRREFVERPVVERPPTAAEQDNQWRTKMKPDGPPPASSQPMKSPALSTSELSTSSSPSGGPTPPTTRPKLNLAKRTVSEMPSESAPKPTADSKSSPFGAAKPVDTATKEKEVEEKRQIAIRERKDTEEKARAEKKAAEEKVREEKKLSKDAEEGAKGPKAEQKPSTPEPVDGEKPVQRREKPEKENGAPAPPAGKNYEILRRAADEDASAADEEAEEAEAADQNGVIAGDKETKPKELVKDSNEGYTNGATPTAESLEEEGWSTVSKHQKTRKNGNQAARAIAS